MEQLFDKIFEMFSLEYSVTVIIASYLCIKFIDFLNKEKVVTKFVKRLVTVVIGVIFFGVFKYFTEISTQTLITSFFFAIFVYDVAIKYLIKKLNVDYK